MEPREVIKRHYSLCENVYQLLLEENSWLKVKKSPPEMEFLDRKKEIVEQLESSLTNLRKLKPEFFSPFDDTKKLVGDSHSKLLQIFYLDRENEDLLVKLNQSFERENFTRFTIDPNQIGEHPNRT